MVLQHGRLCHLEEKGQLLHQGPEQRSLKLSSKACILVPPWPSVLMLQMQHYHCSLGFITETTAWDCIPRAKVSRAQTQMTSLTTTLSTLPDHTRSSDKPPLAGKQHDYVTPDNPSPFFDMLRRCSGGCNPSARDTGARRHTHRSEPNGPAAGTVLLPTQTACHR